MTIENNIKQPKRSETITTKAYNLIKQKLLKGDYMPGQFLQVEKICRDLNLGRTPIYQAVLLLDQEGIVEVIPRKGVHVRTITLNDLRETMEIRLLLEPFCVRQCAENPDPKLVKTLLKCLKQQENLGKQPKSKQLLPLDRDLHMIISSKANNQRISEILRPIHEGMMRPLFLTHWVEEDFLTTIKEHKNIVDAIVQSDGKAAEKAMQVHLKSVCMRMGLK
ncbi:MAG: GntR family transcriptional regulator [Parvularculales bacterium]